MHKQQRERRVSILEIIITVLGKYLFTLKYLDPQGWAKSIHPSIDSSIYVPIYLAIHLSVYLSVYPFAYLFMCLSICLSTYLSICLSCWYVLGLRTLANTRSVARSQAHMKPTRTKHDSSEILSVMLLDNIEIAAA